MLPVLLLSPFINEETEAEEKPGNLPKYGQLLIVGIKPWEAGIAAILPITVLYPVRL